MQTPPRILSPGLNSDQRRLSFNLLSELFRLQRFALANVLQYRGFAAVEVTARIGTINMGVVIQLRQSLQQSFPIAVIQSR